MSCRNIPLADLFMAKILFIRLALFLIRLFGIRLINHDAFVIYGHRLIFTWFMTELADRAGSLVSGLGLSHSGR